MLSSDKTWNNAASFNPSGISPVSKDQVNDWFKKQLAQLAGKRGGKAK